MDNNKLPSNGILNIGLFILSASVLMLELLGMRVLSFTLWHHLAYMVLSVAMLGFGASGAWLASSTKERNPRSVIIWSAILFGVTNLLGFMLLSRLQLDTFEMSSTKLLKLGLYYTVLILPYFFAGLAVAVIFREATEKTTVLYFVNLVGSGVGCYLFMILITPLGGPRALIAASALGLIAAFLWSLNSSLRLCIVSGVGVAILAALTPFADALVPLKPAKSKSLARHLAIEGSKIEYTEWTPLSRIDVLKAPKSFNPFLGDWRTGDSMRTITIDGDANTWMFRHPKLKTALQAKKVADSLNINTDHVNSRDREVEQMLRSNEYALAMLLKRNQAEVLVIGAGGGNEVATALAVGVKHVTAVELNPAILAQSTIHLKDFFGSLYDSERATPVLSEGRSFVRQCERTFDIIQMSGVDTWSGLSTGAYVLSENYLYTVEATRDFLNHLNHDGILSIGRFRLTPPRETLRLVSNALRALRDIGVKHPRQHIIVLTYGPRSTARILIKKSKFTKQEVRFYKKLVAEGRAIESKIWYAPYMLKELKKNPFVNLILAAVQEKKGLEQLFYKRYPYDVTPVYDDKPFFFEYYKWKNMFTGRTGHGGQVGANQPIGLTILFFLIIQVIVLCLIFIFVPLRRLSKRGLPLPHRFKVITGFGALGLAFMFLEVGLMQKLVLFLGHPIYSISVSLFSILVGSGLGSLAAGRLPFAEEKRIVWSIIAIAIITVVYIFALDPLTNALLGLPMGSRQVIAGTLMAVLAFPMGMPFPLSLKKSGELGPSVVPWALGINGGASVLGSILCIFVAMGFGFKAVLAIAALIYLLALPSLIGLMRASAKQ